MNIHTGKLKPQEIFCITAEQVFYTPETVYSQLGKEVYIFSALQRARCMC